MRRSREEAPEYVAGRSYTGHEMELMADDILRKDSRSELCRACGERAVATGEVTLMAQEDIVDPEGNPLVLEYPELSCSGGHTWFLGEGKARGIDGDNPILFEEHIASRRRREIYCAVGTPDPSIQRGLYHRTHPEGRPTNSKEQRLKHGASFYRG